MNAYQKQVLIDNIRWLCETTVEESSLSSWLCVEGVFTKAENDAIQVSRRSPHEKRYTLFNHVIKKPNSFYKLLNCLKKTGNDGIAHFLESQFKEKIAFKKKMVGNSLEKFLIPHLTMLCNETVHPQKVAMELLLRGFISEDDAAIIRDHPDTFCQNAELYKFIQFKCNYEEMMRILRDTENERIANYLDDMAT